MVDLHRVLAEREGFSTEIAIFLFIINSLIALVSTFVGAYSAFSLNNRKETKKIYIVVCSIIKK